MQNIKIILIILIAYTVLIISTGYAQAAKTAKVAVMGTMDSAIIGEVDFQEEKDGLKVTAHLSDVPPGKHGFHVHEKGSCDDKGNAAGGHFNPDGHQHGLLIKDGLDAAHAGDLGNIEIDDKGVGHYTAFVKGLTLSEGKYDIVGKAVILHEKADDFGQPSGNAGGRIGCGIIEVDQ